MSNQSATPADRRAQLAIIGRRSEQQDDSRFVDVDDGGAPATLMILADGMGGATGGAMASRLAVEAAAAHFAASSGDPGERLQGALDAGNQAIGDAVGRDPSLNGMGTTMILALVRGNNATWVSVGDSLLVAVRDGKLERLNADHSLAAVLDDAARRGQISAEEAAMSPQRNMLRSALTGGNIAMIDASEATLAPGTRLVAASDGILTLEFDEIAGLVGGGEVAAALGKVVAAVEADMPDDQDNLTMLAVDIGAAGPAAPAPARPKSRSRSRRVSPWLAAMLVVGVLTLIGALVAVLVLWPQDDGGKPVARPKAAPAPNVVEEIGTPSGAATPGGAKPSRSSVGRAAGSGNASGGAIQRLNGDGVRPTPPSPPPAPKPSPVKPSATTPAKSTTTPAPGKEPAKTETKTDAKPPADKTDKPFKVETDTKKPAT